MADTTVDVRRPWWRRKWGIAAIAVVVIAAIGGALSDDAPTGQEPADASGTPAAETDEAEEPEADEAGGGDASAELACRHFRNVAADADAGILTDAELREKVSEVHDSGRVSETEGVADATQALLAAVTQQDGTLGDAIRTLSDVCDEVGL